MTPEQLKASILQYAIQGKLVEQREEDGTAEELYQQIQKEKQRLIKEGKIKKEKTLPEIVDDEIPFEIPDSWIWTRLGEISWYFDAGKSPNCEKRPASKDEWGVITTTSVQIGFFDEVQNKVLPKSFDVNTAIQVRNNDILITRAGPMNRTGIACLVKNISYNLILSDKTIRLNMTDNNIDKSYIVTALNSPQIRQLIVDKMSGMDKQQVNVSQDKYKTILIPLPPLAEQKRIVDKIEELLPIVDRYAVAYDKLEKFNAKFPKDMKNSILQYAIQGKLVEQRAEDGTGEELYQQIQDEKKKLIIEGKIKKEKPLSEITDDEIPFDIPDSWKWVRLGHCGTFVRGSGIKKDEVTRTGLPCIRYGQLYTHYKTKFNSAVSFVSKELFEKCQQIHQHDILMALTGENNFDIALAVTYEGKEPVAMGGDMTKFTGYYIDPLYFTYVINSPYGIMCKSKLATGNIIVHISNDKLASIPIPLPPLAEQKRIVAEIEELLPYCDRLVKEMDESK